MSKLLWTLSLMIALVATASCGPDNGTPATPGEDGGATLLADAAPPGTVDAAPPGTVDASVPTPSVDAAPLPPGASPGDACSCDADCPSVDTHPGICVYGVCMTQASTTCSAGGSTPECGAGSRCWGLQGVEGSICWPDCDTYTCAGTCDADGSCAPAEGDACDYTCGTYCNCSAGDCGSGEQCVSGQCIPESDGSGPGAGPGPTCASLPPMNCTGTPAFCGELIQFSPSVTTSYDDYAINGENAATQYRSWLRRDHIMLLKYATAVVECKAAAWTTGNGGPLGLGDMSESNGAIPGTAVGSPGHPANTHTNGRDIDIGYYQVGQANNYLRPICEHHDAAGVEQYHCTAAPTGLDVWRTALLLGTLFESPILRVIGVDGKAGPLLVAAINELCTTNWLPASACQDIALAYEETDQGLGWFRFHHHHAHISTANAAPFWEPSKNAMQCIQPGCTGKQFKSNVHMFPAK